MKNYDFLIVGAGIFGITAALELRKRKYLVAILNPDDIPHPLAATTDISKIVRMEYGSDEEYMDMARESMETWREWNDFFDETFYHETSYLMLSASSLDTEEETYEKVSYLSLLKRGLKPERIKAAQFPKRFPAYNPEAYVEAACNPEGGFVESGRVLGKLAEYAEQLGVDIYRGQTVEHFIVENNRIHGVATKEGDKFSAGQVIVCAGNFTPYLLPELKPYMRVTGHPIFHLKPKNPELYLPHLFPTFAADIANTGWYGFPLHPKEKVVKVAKHSLGLELDPTTDERVVYERDIQELREFLTFSFPDLANDPIVYTRRCCYTDTLDGHFWIDHHPAIKGLSVGSGGSGHGMKMGPVIGQMIATMAEEGNHKWSARYRWRDLDRATTQMEEARFLQKRNLEE